jgi:hypothetical protein
MVILKRGTIGLLINPENRFCFYVKNLYDGLGERIAISLAPLREDIAMKTHIDQQED